MLRRIGAVLLGLMGMTAACAASTPTTARGCATYSAAGQLAAVTIRDGRNLSLAVGGSSTPASMTLPNRVTGCRVFFSQASDLLAVGLDVPLQQSKDVNLLILNPNSMEWVTAKPVAIRVAEDSRGPLLGFIGSTRNLLMMQPGNYSPTDDRTTVFVVTIDPFEHTAKTSALAVSGKYVAGVSVVPELPADRLWVVEGDDGDCYLRAYHADGNVAHGSTALTYSDCPGADLMIAGANESVLELNHGDDTLSAHHLDATKTSAAQKIFNRPSERYWFSGTYALSPNREVLAIAAKHVHSSQWGGTRISNEIVLLDTSTLKLVGHIPLPHPPQEFAVASTASNCTLSWLEASGWVSRTLSRTGE